MPTAQGELGRHAAKAATGKYFYVFFWRVARYRLLASVLHGGAFIECRRRAESAAVF
jgi:hypothetical protein